MDLRPYQEDEKFELLQLWEKSVLATHDFLKPTDFTSIKAMLSEFDFSSIAVYGLWSGARLLGFLGTDQGKLEMLFIHPEERKKGYGRSLVDFALKNLNVHAVDVNEQNQQAVGFYETLGFVKKGRSAVDGMGMPYPILHLRKSEHF